MFRRLVLLTAFLLAATFFAQAQQPHPALQSQEAFLSEIAGKKWECSFTIYPELRFFADKIEILTPEGKVTRTLAKLSHPEPGIIRVDFNGGDFQLFVFSDDLQSFVIANMTDMSEITVAGGAARLPAIASSAPLSVSFTGNPFWKEARLHADKMEVLDGSGTVFATNPTFSYFPHVHGVSLPEKRAGAIVMSRQKPGTGWYMSGRNLGTGVQTDKSGYFRTFLRSQLGGTPFALRSAHFSYALVGAGLDDLALGQEAYALKMTRDVYGETSDKVARCLYEMGLLRRYSRSFARAAELHAQAVNQAQQSLASDKVQLLDFSTELAYSQNDAGDFAGAKKTLADAYALLPPNAERGGNYLPTYLFYDALGMAEFGLRNYAQAAKQFTDNIRRAQEAKMDGSVVASLLHLIPCQLAQNQAAAADASLQQCIQVQKQQIKDHPNYNFDTWRLAFTCVALGRSKDAIQFSPVHNQRKNWVSYEEYGRLVSLFHGGDAAAAQSLAKSFVGRFNNIQEIDIRDDIDPVTVKLTQAIADPSPTNVSALEQLWSTQVNSLRNRPLKNFIFARVMVLTIARLKVAK